MLRDNGVLQEFRPLLPNFIERTFPTQFARPAAILSFDLPRRHVRLKK